MATPEHNYEQLRFNIFFALKSLEKEVSFWSELGISSILLNYSL
jgi:hypothetical protein